MRKSFLYLTSAAASVGGFLRSRRTGKGGTVTRRLSRKERKARAEEERQVVAEIKRRLDESREHLKATIEPPE